MAFLRLILLGRLYVGHRICWTLSLPILQFKVFKGFKNFAAKQYWPAWLFEIAD